MKPNNSNFPTTLSESIRAELSEPGVRFLLHHIDSMTEDDIVRMANRLGKSVEEARLGVLGLKAKLALLALDTQQRDADE